MELILAIALTFVIHEGGHYLAALLFCGQRLRFRRKRLRFLWEMPDTALWKQRVVAMAGFGAEFFAAGVFMAACRSSFALWYTGISFLHLSAYYMYARKDTYSDFRWL